jgi:aryl-alcohol dehydrogenase
MQITAAIARAPHGALSIETVDVESPRADEVLVEVVATGICHTDAAMRDQAFPVPQPVVLGHEGSGLVRQVGTGVTSVSPGDRVLMSYNSCGTCASCSASEPGFCHDFFGRNFASVRPDGSTPLSQDGKPIHGNFFGQSSFATFALARERNVVKMPHDADLRRLCPLGCGIQTGAGAVWNALRVLPATSFVVFGAGPVGLSAVLAARVAGAGIIVAVEPVASRRTMALEFGATHAIDPKADEVVTALKAITTIGVNYSLDTTGLPSVIRQATDALAPRGRCAILGASKVGTELTLDAVHMMTGGRHLLGTVEGNSTPTQIIPQILTLYAEGRFPFDRMITWYSFSDINQAIADTEAGVCIKAVLRMPGH